VIGGNVTDNIDVFLERLNPAPGDSLVISVAAIEHDGQWSAVFASILAGPSGMADQSWATWLENAQNDDLGTESLLSTTSRPIATWIKFDYEVRNWRFIRFSVPLSELRDVLTDAIELRKIDVPDADGVTITYGSELRPVRTLWHETTAASRLVHGAGRPITGWYAGLLVPTDVNFSDESGGDEAFPATWTIDGLPIPGGSLFLAGFSTSQLLGKPPEPGVVFGRVDRLAWLGKLRGGPGLETFSVAVLRDENGPMLWDLEIDLEERDDLGLLGFRRLRLSDLRLPSFNIDAVDVLFPTLGTQMIRKVTLTDRDGNLLDGTEGFNIVESIGIKINDEPPRTLVGPQSSTTASVNDRLARMNRVEDEYARLLSEGAKDRIVAVGDDGVARLAEWLEAADEELLVFDPYFDKDANWKVLEKVAIPIRLLTGRKGALPSGALSMASNSLKVKVWAGIGSNPPFHDRAYLWRGGGLKVGTSPSGLGHRLSLLDTLTPTLATDLTKRFETWWASNDFVVI
jgi:hypothetical protein